MYNFGDVVRLKDGFTGKITGINKLNPPFYDVTELDKPYKRVNGVPEKAISHEAN